MKYPALLFFCTGALAAGSPSLPTFSEKLPAGSDLSLSGQMQRGEFRAPSAQAQAAAKWFSNRPVGATRTVSRMPVIDPGERVDRAMPIVRPPDDVDFSMVIRTPRVDAVDASTPPDASGGTGHN